MERSTAEQLLVEFEKIKNTLNRARDQMFIVEKSGDDIKFFIRALGRMNVTLIDEALRPIVKEFPDLDPDPPA